ncbi:Small auxin-up RNA protein [Dioscorea alata]|uniref:Small auxin-up RNA protein n=1 Tax=Dioscorea alata TaxID=55571 RepID=A0ACB7VW77_DIOAL|nr:Small auxin-up RNA protein [Dioscorea alata]
MMHWRRKESQAMCMHERLINEKVDERCTGERARKGYVAVIVGVEDECSEKFLMQVEFLRDPRIAELLEMAAGEFGYRQQGILRIPCDAEYFRQVVAMVAKHR